MVLMMAESCALDRFEETCKASGVAEEQKSILWTAIKSRYSEGKCRSRVGQQVSSVMAALACLIWHASVTFRSAEGHQDGSEPHHDTRTTWFSCSTRWFACHPRPKHSVLYAAWVYLYQSEHTEPFACCFSKYIAALYCT